VVADGSGMGTTVGASSERVAVQGRSLWWARLRRIASAVLAMIAVVLAGSDAVAAATPAGQDVSWPQCSSRQGGYGLPMPSASAPFVVVGLTAGRAFTANPCVASQAAWARRTRVPTSAYLVATYPTRAEVRAWSSGPRRPSTLRDRVYNVGVAQGRAALRVLARSGLRTHSVWVDVERNRRRPWSANPDMNVALIQGVVAAIRAAGYRPGLYTNASSWAVYTDDVRLGLPEWRTVGPRSRALAEQACAARPLNGGTVLLVQYWTSTVDSDVACPVLASRAAKLRWFAAS
jgi:hypothetical protein